MTFVVYLSVTMVVYSIDDKVMRTSGHVLENVCRHVFACYRVLGNSLLVTAHLTPG